MTNNNNKNKKRKKQKCETKTIHNILYGIVYKQIFADELNTVDSYMCLLIIMSEYVCVLLIICVFKTPLVLAKTLPEN